MYFELLQSISLNGSLVRPNEDRVGISLINAWVIDGATDLAEVGLFHKKGGAQWIASTSDIALSGCVEPDIFSSCKWLFKHLEMKFDEDRQRDILGDWELPSAAFAFTKIIENELQIAWAADCYALHISGSIGSWCTDAPDMHSEANEARTLGLGIGAQKTRSKATIENRRQKRCHPDYKALTPNLEKSITSTKYSNIPVKSDDSLLLMSDGFVKLVGDYSKYSLSQFVEALQKKGLAELACELRHIENRDAACVEYPRFKISDDATAIWMRITK